MHARLASTMIDIGSPGDFPDFPDSAQVSFFAEPDLET
jgi:hypothetical protein